MKFKVKTTFKHGHSTFEAGNSHDAATAGLSDDQVLEFRRVGWVDVEGMEPGPDARPGAQRITVHDAVHVTGRS